jgi:hypothetical protein
MAKGGKGRKGGGGGGGKTRKYSRDNKGRFASTGSGGATARGGRLKTASGNKRKTQTITAKGQKGVLAKPKGLKPGAIKPKAAPKPAALSTKAKSPKFTTEQSGRVRRAALGGGRTAIVRKNSAVIINAKGEPIMTRKGLPNITAGKKYAANPNARGPRLMGRDRSEASPSRGYIRTSKPTGTIGKPKGLKPESTNKLKTGIFISKRRAVNAQLANKPDQAVVNIPGRFTGRAGKSFDASITRAVATVKASKDAKFKTKAEVKADQAKAKAAKEAKPKRIRSAESLRVSRAKQIEKRRSITTNPAGVRASAAAKMAANATRTQQRAAAFYKAGGKPAAAKPAAAKRKSVGSISEAKAGRIISRIDANRPGLRRASGSARKTANVIRTHKRATDFALAASARGRKQGKNLSVNQSLQRAIKTASAKRKPRGMR